MKRLFEQFKPEHYDLVLNLDIAKGIFEGTVVITGKKTGRPSKRLTLHQNGLKISAAEIIRHEKKSSQDLPLARINRHEKLNEVRLHTEGTAYPGKYTLTLRFSGKIQDGLHGIYRSTYDIEGKQKTIISTQFESHHAREAFPCIDEPEAKATFDLTLITPSGEAVISNMPLKSQADKDRSLTTSFETTPRMSTYLLAFVCGDLQYKEVMTKDNVAVRLWSTKVHSLDSLGYALDVIKKGIEFFNDYYGVPYPLPKSDNVAIPDFSSAAMENWGLITYREVIILTDPKTASQSNRETAAIVSLHELSHQWFGNLVTMKWWDDLWLNESFANVMEYVATDALFPEWHIWDTFTGMEGLSALRRDAIAGVQAVKTAVNHPDEISSLFDPSIVYAKGGRLLNMLMHYLGEENFRTALKAYFMRHAYGNTTGDDLWAALSEASGKDISAFMSPWLNRSGFPVVHVSQNGESVTITQKHFSLNTDKVDETRVWPVPTLSENAELPTLLEASEQTIQLSSKDYIRLNRGAIGHYMVHYTDPGHRQAIAQLIGAKQIDASERLMMLNESAMLARGGIQSFTDTLQLLNQYTSEDSEPVWDVISVILADLKRFIDSGPSLEDKIKSLIRTLIEGQFQRLGWTELPGEPVQDTKLRATIIGLGVYAQHEGIVNHALKLYDDYHKDESAIPAELRAIIFGAAIRNRVKGAFSNLLKLEESTENVNLKQDLLGALTLTKTASEVEILLNRLKDSKKVRQHDVDHWLVYLMQNRFAQEQAWGWLRSNWVWIKKTFSGDKSYDYFPRYAASALNTRKRLDEYREFFEPYKDDPSLGRNVTMGIEELSMRITWLERDAKPVRDYLQ